jgi:hypothetical protein
MVYYKTTTTKTTTQTTTKTTTKKRIEDCVLTVHNRKGVKLRV